VPTHPALDVGVTLYITVSGLFVGLINVWIGMELPEVRLVTPVTPLVIVVHVKVVPDKLEVKLKAVEGVLEQIVWVAGKFIFGKGLT
jgi:hypothetical protein